MPIRLPLPRVGYNRLPFFSIFFTRGGWAVFGNECLIWGMIANIAWDVAVGPSRPIALILAGFFIAMVAWEGGILALMGLRPYPKAFVSSFLVNMAALGAGFVGYLAFSLIFHEPLAHLFTLLLAVAVQGLVLSTNRQGLGKGRAWLAAVLMKVCSFGLFVAFYRLMDA